MSAPTSAELHAGTTPEVDVDADPRPPGPDPRPGEQSGPEPITETLVRFSGAIFTDRDLSRGTPVHVTVTLDDGVTVANGYGQIEGVVDKDVYKKVDGERVFDHAERIHVAKVS